MDATKPETKHRLTSRGVLIPGPAVPRVDRGDPFPSVRGTPQMSVVMWPESVRLRFSAALLLHPLDASLAWSQTAVLNMRQMQYMASRKRSSAPCAEAEKDELPVLDLFLLLFPFLLFRPLPALWSISMPNSSSSSAFAVAGLWVGVCEFAERCLRPAPEACQGCVPCTYRLSTSSRAPSFPQQSTRWRRFRERPEGRCAVLLQN